MTGPDATVAVSGTVSPEAATQARPRRYRVHAGGRPVGAKGPKRRRRALRPAEPSQSLQDDEIAGIIL
jgi:hypothetical protein